MKGRQAGSQGKYHFRDRRGAVGRENHWTQRLPGVLTAICWLCDLRSSHLTFLKSVPPRGYKRVNSVHSLPLPRLQFILEEQIIIVDSHQRLARCHSVGRVLYAEPVILSFSGGEAGLAEIK